MNGKAHDIYERIFFNGKKLNTSENKIYSLWSLQE